MKELVELVAKAIVDHPDQVEVTQEDLGDQVVLRLRVAEEDMGRIIGKQGRIANALRTLLRVAAARQGTKAVLEIG
ncbi:MAG: KH domain-containing protein [Dehalococcoidia bacterium]|jgi:predicted RNA-binding protein YlqC (UPF0109 family)|nr:KH domain-containing protein [Dehalococcoidia bacterium]